MSIMSIGVFHVDTRTPASASAYVWAKAMVRSVRQVMPGTPVVHFTDQESRAIKGVDAVRRKPSEPMALLRMRHHASVQGQWLFVDTDVIVQRRVTRVFRDHPDFDIATTSRDWAHLKAAVGFTARMPMNTGVVFSRCPRFWGEVYTRLRQRSPDEQQWMGDQAVICEMVLDPDTSYRICHLKGSRFNYPPVVPESEAIRRQRDRQAELDAFIVHYKGAKRKAMLLDRIKAAS